MRPGSCIATRGSQNAVPHGLIRREFVSDRFDHTTIHRRQSPIPFRIVLVRNVPIFESHVGVPAKRLVAKRNVKHARSSGPSPIAAVSAVPAKTNYDTRFTAVRIPVIVACHIIKYIVETV